MFCQECGKEISAQAVQCPGCRAPIGVASHGGVAHSPKSYGVAVALSGIFGVVGIHHFYLGNILHGLIDAGLLLTGVAFIGAGETNADSGFIAFGVLLLLIDVLHTLIVTYRLIAGKQKDGHGRLVVAPGTAGPGP